MDRPGCWKFSKDAEEFTPKKPVVYLNLYNNQWNTNFRYWYPGTWSSSVRLWTFDAKTPADKTAKVAEFKQNNIDILPNASSYAANAAAARVGAVSSNVASVSGEDSYVPHVAEGIIEATDEFRLSSRAVCHRNPKRVWRRLP